MIGPNSERLVRIPNDWSECRMIGPNSERLVRMPNDWSEFRTIDDLDVGVFKNRKKKRRICWIALLLRCGGSCVQSNFENVQVLMAEKKSAWTDLDKVKRAYSAASVFKISSRLVTWGSPKRFALRWPDLDKRCSRCYTLRGCVFADLQSREEVKMLLQAKRQPG